jgi:hypothetical protein
MPVPVLGSQTGQNLLVSSPPAETLNSRRSTEADVVAEDIIVHYEKPAIYLQGPAITAEVLGAASDPRAGVSRRPASGLDL